MANGVLTTETVSLNAGPARRAFVDGDDVVAIGYGIDGTMAFDPVEHDAAESHGRALVEPLDLPMDPARPNAPARVRTMLILAPE